jgi:DNA-binding MarR family transcriptional regulator
MPVRPLPPGVVATRRNRLANRLNSAAIHLLRRAAQADGDDGVTGARLSALSVLVFGGVATLSELARREGVSLPTMSRLVDALVREGLVTRVADETDRRAVRIEASARGRDVLERGRARRIARLAAELERLTGAELGALERALGALERLERQIASRADQAAPDARERRPGPRPSPSRSGG